MSSYCKLAFRQFYSLVMVSNTLRKRSFHLADIESRIESAMNVVNDMRGDACNVFFAFVGTYLLDDFGGL